MNTFTDSPYYTFSEETAGALTGKEFLALELGTAAGTAKLAAGTNPAIAVMHGKLEGDDCVNARLLGKGGTLKVKAGGVIAKGARVIVDSDGMVITLPAAAGTYRTIGIKLTQGNSADGDVIEIADVIENITVS